jgi:hypothetical protein
MSLDFASRLNLLTGDNGLGKSFVLDIAWWILTGTWAGQQPWPGVHAGAIPRIDARVGREGEKPAFVFAGGYNFSEEKWVSQLPLDSSYLVLYARVDGSFSVWDSIRNTKRPWSDVLFSNPYSSWAYRFSPQEIWDGLSQDGRILCEGLIRDWVSWQRQETEAYLQLGDVLTVLSPAGEELRPGRPIRLSVGDVRDHPTLDMPYGMLPLIFASAGMKRVITLAYLLVWAWQEHQQAAKLRHRPQVESIILLIDEMEAHLHPEWQRRILPALLKVAARLSDNVKVQVLITTHSPLVLASAEPLFDEEKDALFTFDLKGGQVEVSRADWRSRGDASSWLTSDVFDLGEARSVEAEQAIQQAKEAMRQPDLPMEARRRIHHELNAVLKDTDPFWSRWLVQAKAAGIEP